jgi:hypothetical protein
MNDPVAAEIRKLASPCPICGKKQLTTQDGHQYALLASEIARGPSEELQRFFELYKSHSWPELHAIQNFEGAANAALIYLFLCGNRAAMLAVRGPAELYDADTLLDLVLLGEQEAESVRGLVASFREL